MDFNEEYKKAVTEFKESVDRIRKGLKFLFKSVEAAQSKFGIGFDDELPDEAVPFLAMGISVALHRWDEWIRETRWQLKSYDYDHIWSIEFYSSEEFKELYDLAQSIIIRLNTIDAIARGNWKELYSEICHLIDDLDNVECIHRLVMATS